MILNEIINDCQINQQESLNISHQGLVVLPAQIAQLKDLKKLFLNDNHLILPPDEPASNLFFNDQDPHRTPTEQILQLDQLEELVLDRNRLTLLPNISSLKHLTYLGLNHNPFTVLPEILGDLSELREFWAVDCGLISVPRSIGKLNKLTKLGLSNNALMSLPAEFGSLGSLQWLSLANNKLQDVPEEVKNLQSLVFINLDGNSFDCIPKALTDIPSLQVLLLKFNRISSVEDELIPAFSRLTKLDLRQNPLTLRPHHWKGLNCILLNATEEASMND